MYASILVYVLQLKEFGADMVSAGSPKP